MSPYNREQETIINWDPVDQLWRFWTEVPHHLRALAADDRFTMVRSGTHADGTPWGEFTAPSDRWSPTRGIKRRMSDAERAARISYLPH